MKKEQILKLNATPHKTVIALTGGGTLALGELLKYGQGSNKLLEAFVPYDTKALDEFIHNRGGKLPYKYCSSETAQVMALEAFHRAKKLTQDNCVGLGVTCSLAKDNERPDRTHNVYLAIQTEKFISSHHLKLNDSRENEEILASEFILNALAFACNQENDLMGMSTDVFYNALSEDYSKLLAENVKYFRTKYFSSPHIETPKVVFPGSFNPLHTGHIDILKMAYELTGIPASLEISLRNVDKPEVDFLSYCERKNKIYKEIGMESYFDDILVTNAPTFIEKARLFPEAKFIVGDDTFARMLNEKYYQKGTFGDFICELNELQTQFLIFPRKINGVTRTKQEVWELVPTLLVDNCTYVDFETIEISSTQIRNLK